MVVVLPVPLTPTTRMTCGLCAASSASGRATGCRIAAISCASAPRTSSGGNLLVEARLGQFGGQPRRRRRAEIGGDQQLFQFLQRRFIEPRLREDAGDARRELASTTG